MEWIKNLKLAHKMGFISLAIIALIVIIELISFNLFSSFHNESQDLIAQTNTQEQLAAVRLLVEQALMPANDYLITGSGSERTKFKDISGKLEQTSKELEATLNGTIYSKDLDQIITVWLSVKKDAQKILQIKNPVGNKSGANMMEAMDTKTEKLTSTIETLAGNIKNNKDLIKKNMENKWVQLKVSYSILDVFVIILLVLIGIMIFDTIIKPIKNVIDGLNIGSEEVSSASSQIFAASQSLAEVSSEQAAAIQETSSTLEETSSMVHQNRENTQQAAVLAKQAKQYAEKSNTEMVKMSDSMNNLKNSSNEIAKIIKVIDEIAFQTNILSLNAAVEAARAGDAGKGFAVVAEEVRNLAQRSAQAAKDTTIIIESNIDLSDSSVNIAKAVRESVASIEEQATKVSDLLDEIAVATNEQAQGVEQIHKAVSQMEIALQSNASTADESAAASHALQNQTINLKNIIGSLVTLVEGADTIGAHDNLLTSESTYRAQRVYDVKPAEVMPRVNTTKLQIPTTLNTNKSKQLISWNEGYSVGVADMDSQHKQLISMINDLYDAMQNQKAAETIGKILKRLIAYTKTHFAKEEEIMEKYSYPELNQQIKEHRAFTDKIQKFKDDYDSGRTAMSVSVTSFLKDWLMHHISVNDKKYGPHFNSKGVY